MISKLATRMRHIAANKIKSAGFFRNYWYPRFEFQMSPRQLCYLASCLDKIKSVDGAIVEIGCAHGLTTSFLYEYMIDSEFKKDYFCIDTFDGFTEEDIAVEVTDRNKTESVYTKIFKDNNPKWFEEASRRRRITDVHVVQADISELSEDKLPKEVAFCLIDVDLYRPVQSALEKVYPRLSAGGIIVVDDCWYKPNKFVPGVPDAYDGAMQAYREFLNENELPARLVESKLGIIERG